MQKIECFADRPSFHREDAGAPSSRNTGHNSIHDIHPLPFVGTLIEQPTPRKLTFAYVLDLTEDLYLNDHQFVRTAPLKPPEACLPVVPLAFSMEMMAEAAACLVPGCGLTGFENVRASQWIDLDDARQTKLIISAVRDDHDSKDARRVHTTIRKDGMQATSISATVLLGRQYRLSIDSRFESDDILRPFAHTTDFLYKERFLFHGPLLHCVKKIQAIGKKTIIGEIATSPHKQLFRSIKKPQLLTAPDLIDGLAQLICAWLVDKSWWALPISIEKMEFYRPVPEPGIRLPAYLQIKKSGQKTITTDLEVHDGAHKVWMRVRNWRYWIIRFTPETSNFLRMPDKFLISRNLNMPGQPAGHVACSVSEQDLRDVNMDWLSRTCLHLEELPAYKGLHGQPAHQRQWLLARAAAKDAVRLWCSRKYSAALLHPAAIRISDGRGEEMLLEKLPGMLEKPRVRVLKTTDGWVGIAYSETKVDADRTAPVDSRRILNEAEVDACP